MGDRNLDYKPEKEEETEPGTQRRGCTDHRLAGATLTTKSIRQVDITGHTRLCIHVLLALAPSLDISRLESGSLSFSLWSMHRYPSAFFFLLQGDLHTPS
jgi:hypothetical protein